LRGTVPWRVKHPEELLPHPNFYLLRSMRLYLRPAMINIPAVPANMIVNHRYIAWSSPVLGIFEFSDGWSGLSVILTC